MTKATNTNRPTCSDIHTTEANSSLLVCNRIKGHQGSHTDTSVPGQVRVWPKR